MKAFLMLVVAVAVVAIKMTTSFSNCGAAYSCRNQVPGHVNCVQGGPAPYRVSVDKGVLRAGETTRVTLDSTGHSPLRGFLCSASDMLDSINKPVGLMSLHAPSNSSRTSIDGLKLLTCSRSTKNTAITHTSSSDKHKVHFDWTAPHGSLSGQQYKLRCTVVKVFIKCWTNLQANITIGMATAQISSAPTQTSSNLQSDSSTGRRGSKDSSSRKTSTSTRTPKHAGPDLKDSPTTNNEWPIAAPKRVPAANVGSGTVNPRSKL